MHIVSFDEPFGFSVVEAMACGTPVIAARRGSMPEIIIDGVNGQLVDSLDEAAQAVTAAVDLQPEGVRASVDRRFNRWRMVDEYIAVYRRIVAGRPARDSI